MEFIMPGQDIVSASRGKREYTIVVNTESPLPEMFTAQELQKYISLISQTMKPREIRNS